MDHFRLIERAVAFLCDAVVVEIVCLRVVSTVRANGDLVVKKLLFALLQVMGTPRCRDSPSVTRRLCRKRCALLWQREVAQHGDC